MKAPTPGYDAPLQQMALVDNMIRGLYRKSRSTADGIADIGDLVGGQTERGYLGYLNRTAPLDTPRFSAQMYSPNDRQARYDLASVGEQEPLIAAQHTDKIRYHHRTSGMVEQA
ncbi:hypothetical protein HYS47_03180 [Candidatus Woesearchaeota archaeon]|nr:hypothetical protein [Candidatus Woesearchaeota archaeon]